MPLLVGLIDQNTARRRSLDVWSSGHADGSGAGVGSAEDGYTDLDELAERRTKGGNMLDSVANMANSILGAGEMDSNCYFLLRLTIWWYFDF